MPVTVAINASLNGADNVNGIIHLRTMHLGPEQLLVAAKLDFDPTLNVAQLVQAINDAEAGLRAAVPFAATIYIEPDIRRQPAE